MHGVKIVEEVHEASKGDMDRKCELLRDRLAGFSKEEVTAFSDHFDQAWGDAYTWELWGAAYVIQGGCSDDSFSDFRATLISLGREVYSKALADPESLADLAIDDALLFLKNAQNRQGQTLFGRCFQQVAINRFIRHNARNSPDIGFVGIVGPKQNAHIRMQFPDR